MSGESSVVVIAEGYMHSILGQQTPKSLSQEDIAKAITQHDSSGDDHEPAKSLWLQLLRVDSLFNLGQAEAAQSVLREITLQGENEGGQRVHFQQGLEALLEGNLTHAYSCFVQASTHATGLEAVFYGERAVNVRFA